MPETYANIPLFVAQMKVLLPFVILVLVAIIAWATYEEHKAEKSGEDKKWK